MTDPRRYLVKRVRAVDHLADARELLLNALDEDGELAGEVIALRVAARRAILELDALIAEREADGHTLSAVVHNCVAALTTLCGDESAPTRAAYCWIAEARKWAAAIRDKYLPVTDEEEDDD